MRQRNFVGRILAAGVVTMAVAGTAVAADADPNGNWIFTLTFPDFGQGEFKLACRLVMKEAGGKLTGKIGSTEGEGIVDILEGTYKDQEVAFNVVDPQGFKSSYKGKVDGDTIKGRFQLDIGAGEPLALDWSAKREKDAK